VKLAQSAHRTPRDADGEVGDGLWAGEGVPRRRVGGWPGRRVAVKDVARTTDREPGGRTDNCNTRRATQIASNTLAGGWKNWN